MMVASVKISEKE